MLTQNELKPASRWQTLFSILLAAILPLCFTGCWVYLNTQLPTADAATFMSNVGDLYHQFVSLGWWEGIKGAYFIRAWRPVIFPVFSIPAMLLTHGAILTTVKTVALFSIFLTAAYTYLFMRLALNRFPAILAANLVGLLPLIQEQALSFYAECFLFPCLIASLYYLIRSDYLRNIKSSVAFMCMLSLAMMLRPIETIIHFGFVFMLFVGCGWQQGIFQWRQLRSVALLSITAIFMFFFCAGVETSTMQSRAIVDGDMRHFVEQWLNMTALATLVVWLGMAVPPLFREINALRQRIQNGERPTLLVPIIAGTLTLIVLWYAPAAMETIQWLYLTSFGSVAASTQTTKALYPTLLSELQFHMTAEGRALLIALGLLSLASIAMLGKRQGKAVLFSMPFLFLVVMVPLPLYEILFTVQDILRKMSVASPAMIMALLLICLWPGRAQRLRTAFVAALLLAEFAGLTYTVFMQQYVDVRLDKTFGYYIDHPIRTFPNPHNVVKAYLDQATKKYHVSSVSLEINPNLANPIDPFLMSAMVYIEKPGYSAGIAYFGTYDENHAKNLSETMDSVLISDSVNRMVISAAAAEAYKKTFENETNPTVKTIEQLLYHYADNTLATVGWKVADCFVVKKACDSGVTDCNACLLLPVKK